MGSMVPISDHGSIWKLHTPKLLNVPHFFWNNIQNNLVRTRRNYGSNLTFNALMLINSNKSEKLENLKLIN